MRNQSDHRTRLIAWLDKHKRGPRVRERILRLNPDPQEGYRIRGWHPAKTLSEEYCFWGSMGKREFLAKYGRDAWDRTPARWKRKSGKRTYIQREAVQDCIWRHY